MVEIAKGLSRRSGNPSPSDCAHEVNPSSESVVLYITLNISMLRCRHRRGVSGDELPEWLCAQSSNPVLLLFFELVLNCQGVYIFVEALQNLIPKCRLTLSVPFLLEQLVLMTSIAQAKPASILCRAQISGCANPYLPGYRASHRVHAKRGFLFLEFSDRFFS